MMSFEHVIPNDNIQQKMPSEGNVFIQCSLSLFLPKYVDKANIVRIFTIYVAEVFGRDDESFYAKIEVKRLI